MITIIDKPMWIIAEAHPDRFNVYRSSGVKMGNPLSEPACEYIRAHGLVLAMSERFKDSRWMRNTVVAEVYTRPEVRAEILESMGLPDLFEQCPYCQHYHDPGTIHHMTKPGECTECTGLHR